MRIASLAPSVTYMLQELGAAQSIVACTSLCPLPTLERQAKTVGTFSVLDDDKIAACQPDLIVTATLVQAQSAVRLQAAGHQVVHLDPRSLAEIADNYLTLGQLVGRPQQGQALHDNFLQQLSELSTMPSHTPLRVYMEEWHNPPFAAGNWVPDIVTAAGGMAVLSPAGEASRPITLPELMAADPDAIIQHVCLPPLWIHDTVSRTRALVQRKQQRTAMKNHLLARPGWQKLHAVQAGYVYSLDDTPFNMPTSGVLAGISQLRETIELIQTRVRA